VTVPCLLLADYSCGAVADFHRLPVHSPIVAVTANVRAGQKDVNNGFRHRKKWASHRYIQLHNGAILLALKELDGPFKARIAPSNAVSRISIH
jgi:hypothetical protein